MDGEVWSDKNWPKDSAGFSKLRRHAVGVVCVRAGGRGGKWRGRARARGADDIVADTIVLSFLNREMSWTQGKPHCKSSNVGAKTSKKNVSRNLTPKKTFGDPLCKNRQISAPNPPKTIVSAILSGMAISSVI